MTMTAHQRGAIVALDCYLKVEREELAKKARSLGLIVFNPDTDPDTCERVRGLSDEVIHAEEDERMRDFTVEHFSELTMRGLETAEDHYSYGRDSF